jgi:Xaa-Pro aminopeptidase
MSTRRLLALSVSVMAVIAIALSLPRLAPVSRANSDKRDKPASSVFRAAPPAPVIDNELRLRELASRRARVAEKIGPNGVLVLFSGELRVYANDVDYEYRQENNLYYLTNLKQKGATLVLMPGNTQTREVLFLPKRNPGAETWTGHMYSPEEARNVSGIGDILEASEFASFMTAIRTRQAYTPKAENVFLTTPGSVALRGPASPGMQLASTHLTSIAVPSGFEKIYAAASQGDA